jgi:5-methylcytosine-specific restriction endonuclease McrA
MRAKQICSISGCPNLQPCKIHPKFKLIDAKRGNARERGYSSYWDSYSKRFLKTNPLCKRCADLGIVEVANVVDHIIPIQSANDPNFWNPANHQSLSYKCHSIKTAEDQQHGNVKATKINR